MAKTSSKVNIKPVAGTQNRVVVEAAAAEEKTASGIIIPDTAKEKPQRGIVIAVSEKDDKGNSTVVSCPGLFGSWPYIDKCRNYACIFFTKSLLGEQKKDFYLALKNTIDQQINAACN